MWKKENDTEALKCWKLEQVIKAQVLGNAPPEMLTLDNLLSEEGMVEGFVALIIK